MKIYIKNKTIQEIEAKSKWLKEKPKDINDYDYLCDRYIKTLSKNVRGHYSVSSEQDYATQSLQEAKDKKIDEVRSNTKSLITSKYSATAQLNILMSGDNIKISDMNAKIESIIIKSRSIRSKIMSKDCDTLEKLNNITTEL